MSQHVNRRQFIGHSVAAGAAAGLLLKPGAVSAQSASDKVVVGVMGLSRGRALAVNFARQSNVEVKYMCDVDINRATAGAQVVEGAVGRTPQAVTDFRHILDDNDVDALVCAAPNHWHAPATILACKAGKHVYVEKPGSNTPEEGKLMVKAARKYNRAVQMGAQRRSGPGTHEAIQKLHEGIIGRVYHVRTWYNNARGSIGVGQETSPPSHLDYELWQGPAPRVPYRDNVVHYNWHWMWHWGNGELGNNGVHTLDLCRWGLNVDYPTRVTSSGGRYRFEDDQETPDTHIACFEFEGGGMISWQGLSCNRHGEGFITFYGEDGALQLDSNGTHRVYDERDRMVEETSSPSLGETEHLVDFLDAIRSDQPLSLNCEIEEGQKSALMCHLGNIAQRTGRTINCDPENGLIVGDEEAMKLWSRQYAEGWEPTV